MGDTFKKLNAINVNENTEKKDGLTYLSWAWAWAELKKVYPDATYQIRQFDGKPYLFDENLGYMVMTEMTIDGMTHEMWLPVMNGANKAMKDKPYTVQTKYKEITVQPATMFDINTAIMRCLTKNIAMFGLGLYIYAGEDLPEDSEERKEAEKQKAEIEKKSDDISKMKISKIKVDSLANKAVADNVPLKRILELYKVPDIESMTEKQYRNCMDNWKKIVEMN